MENHETIRDQILAVRDTGIVNMFDAEVVQEIADKFGFRELLNFIEEHKKEYVRFILTGEWAEEEPKEETNAGQMILTRNIGNNTLAMHGVGYRDFKGSVDVTDPCYNRDVWCRMNSVEIAKGKYLCATWKNDELWSRFGEGRIHAIGIYLDGKVPGYSTMEEIGQIGVDAGLAGFFHDKPDFSNKEWYDFCSRIGDGDVFIESDSFFSSSGYGDGCYRVYATKNDNGVIVSLEIRFIEEECEEEECAIVC